jgi:ABC-type multidrug transport system fused ATPase/permease subunit
VGCSKSTVLALVVVVVVPQEPFLFATSIHDNITCGA